MSEYPKIPSNIANPKRPFSFICVKFCSEFEHNIAKSECVHNDLNEFIVIDNTANLFYSTLGQAINAGIKQATHDLLVIVHEDVVLLPGWQSLFEQSLNALEAVDPEWLVAGVVGWDAKGDFQGHLSDPHSYRNSLLDNSFAEINRIDEQVLILRKSKGLFPDPELPGIHHIGRDLTQEVAKKGLKAYVLNAPSIHKYADEQGKLIETAKDSLKIQLRRRLGYLAERACSDEYIEKKWPILNAASMVFIQSGPWVNARVPEFIQSGKFTDQYRQDILDAPIILLAKGGGGSRLLSVLASDINLFIGNDVNPTGDSREMARSIYRAVIRKFRCPNEFQKVNIVPDLQATAAQMLEQANWPEKWAFKLPESLFILPELSVAFPNASYVFLERDPLATVLRRPHMTASLDNQIGQITLALAYDFFEISRDQILVDGDMVHKSRATAHQFELIENFRQYIPDEKWLRLRFEDLMSIPESLLLDLSDFTGQEVVSKNILLEFDQERASRTDEDYSDEMAKMVTTILEPIRSKFGYR
jgi:hypothetical protein